MKKSVASIYLLSDGCKPTEDLYFWDSAVPFLRRRNYTVKRVDCRRYLPGRDVLFDDAVVIVCRSLSAAWIKHLEKNRPKRLVYIIDDYFSGAATSDGLPRMYQKKLSEVDLIAQRILALANDVLVSSHSLLQRYADYAPMLLNPSMPAAAFTSAIRLYNQPVISYHGTRAHLQDLEHIAPAINDVLGEQSVFKTPRFYSLMGRHTPQTLRDCPNVKCAGPYSWGLYKRLRPFMKAQISLAPLLDTPFNSGKSWIKFLDITAIGAVGVYSKRAPYADLIDDGITGLLASDDPAHWRECMLRLIDDPIGTQKMAVAAQKKARAIAQPKWHYRFWRRLLDND